MKPEDIFRIYEALVLLLLFAINCILSLSVCSILPMGKVLGETGSISSSMPARMVSEDKEMSSIYTFCKQVLGLNYFLMPVLQSFRHMVCFYDVAML